MSRRKAIQAKEDVSANLIAMIDIMFLLLLFFMLGADMTQRELAELVLPNADQVEQEKKEKAAEDEFRSTVNVCHVPDSSSMRCVINAKGGVCREANHWMYEIRSEEFSMETIKDKINELAASAMEAEINATAGKRMSKRKLSIRADKFAPYGYVQQAITYAGMAGIYMIEVAAAKPPVEKKP
ncbi:MAG TPA: biopolymer transporter ExbD [Planctomycetota bacterium]|nr:biopolymer transporter ExbD [Planctomycetota bacterium]